MEVAEKNQEREGRAISLWVIIGPMTHPGHFLPHGDSQDYGSSHVSGSKASEEMQEDLEVNCYFFLTRILDSALCVPSPASSEWFVGRLSPYIERDRNRVARCE